MRTRNAFTLVELSIVLVIAGLILGAVTFGTGMLNQANVQSVVDDIEKFHSAHQNFRDRYGSLAGDMPDATTIWNGVTNGNGDGQVAPLGSQESEHFGYWHHLQKAGLIKGNYTGVNAAGGPHFASIGVNVPESAIDGVGYYIEYYDTTDTHPWLWDGFRGHIVYVGKLNSGGIPGGDSGFYTKDAEYIDRKVDDGKPSFGEITSRKPDTNCNTNTTNANTAEYNLSYTQADACSVFVRFN